jgi:hypothetical protein
MWRRFGFRAPLLVAIVLAGCATLPPVKQIEDVKILAGDWEGLITLPSDDQIVRVRLTIKEDGSLVVPTSTSTVNGTIYLSGGQALFRTSRPSSGTVTLYEGDGKRMLRFVATDGVSTDVTPVK